MRASGALLAGAALLVPVGGVVILATTPGSGSAGFTPKSPVEILEHLDGCQSMPGGDPVSEFNGDLLASCALGDGITPATATATVFADPDAETRAFAVAGPVGEVNRTIVADDDTWMLTISAPRSVIHDIDPAALADELGGTLLRSE